MKTGAVIVLFNPDVESVSRLLTEVEKQVDVVCIVDNSPQPAKLCLQFDGLNYHHFPNNVGIAAAHNIGLRDLMLSDCQYGVLFDQDSEISANFVVNLINSMQVAQHVGKPLLAIGPKIICSFSDRRVRPRVQKAIYNHEQFECVSQIISSGMLIELDKLDSTGLKEEGLFIDGVDHEWCWRAKQQDLSVGIAKNVEMVHRLGDSRSQFAGVTYKVGSPIRLYYQFRNILLLVRRSYVPKYWKMRNLCVMPIRLLANSILQENRRERLKYMLKGIWDGLHMRDGSYADNWKR
ncbi:glycosyltransferase family 2 protein [Aestuariibacter salexigens]|uniref:glycosyltransferase family 2 protein n=1 Tax=Aestuariibacter salexigens TaxID=226010 RepID=UPI0004186FF5|nr:glycosyltransferase family 2 protein [Aestuariibacter salexigens]